MVTTSLKAYLPHSGGTELIGNVCGFPVKHRLAGDRPCKAPTCLSRLQMASGVGALRNGGEVGPRRQDVRKTPAINQTVAIP